MLGSNLNEFLLLTLHKYEGIDGFLVSPDTSLHPWYLAMSTLETVEVRE